ncbi:MAG: NUDIX domain-containing protein [archaeon]
MSEYNGVMAIVFKRGDPDLFVLIHNIRTGNITVVAGGVEDHDESTLHAFHREMEEESGLKPEDYKVIETPFVNDFICEAKKTERAGQRILQKVYIAETEKTEIISQDPDVEFIGWFTAEQALEKMTFDDNKEIFKKALKMIS